MRIFPRAHRRVAVAALAATAVVGIAIPLTDPGLSQWAWAADSDDLKQKQKEVKKGIKAAGEELAESSAEAAKARKSLDAANATLAGAQTKLNSARAALAKVEAKLTTAKAKEAKLRLELERSMAALEQAAIELEAGKDAAQEQRYEAESTLISLAQGGDPRILALASLLKVNGPEDLARQQAFNATVVSGQAAAYGDLRATEVLLEVRQDQMERETAKVAAQRREAGKQLKVIEGLEDEAIKARDSVAALVSQAAQAQGAAKSAADDAQSQKNSDLKLLEQLKAEEKRVRLQILADSKNDTNRNVSSTSGIFGKPVANAYVTSPYGWRNHPIYGYWGLHDGDDLRAPCGTPLLAIDDGRVTETSFSSVWGNRLFLNLGKINGHNYTAIYNHISTYRVSEGAVVGRGETVALAGTTGWSTGCHLHFTLLKDGNAIKPSSMM